MTPAGAFEVPADPRTVGWWAAGPLPGRPVAGPAGERVTLTGAAGRTWDYVMRARRAYAKADLPAATFAGTGPGRLVLVTCGGTFDRATGHYADNVVVQADPIAPGAA